MTDEEEKAVLNDFANKLINNQEDLPEEFQKVIDDKWWELLNDN